MPTGADKTRSPVESCSASISTDSVCLHKVSRTKPSRTTRATTSTVPSPVAIASRFELLSGLLETPANTARPTEPESKRKRRPWGTSIQNAYTNGSDHAGDQPYRWRAPQPIIGDDSNQHHQPRRRGRRGTQARVRRNRTGAGPQRRALHPERGRMITSPLTSGLVHRLQSSGPRATAHIARVRTA